MIFEINQNQVAIAFEINAFAEIKLLKFLCGLSVPLVPTPLLFMTVLNDSLTVLVYERGDDNDFMKGINDIIDLYNTEEFDRVFGEKSEEFVNTHEIKLSTDEQYYKFIDYENHKHKLRKATIYDGLYINTINYDCGMVTDELCCDIKNLIRRL